MMRLLTILVVLAVLGDGSACGAGRVVLIGNSHLSSKTLLAAASGVDCAAGDSLCVEDICRAVAACYWEAGYLDARVECAGSRPGSDSIPVFVVEGDLSKLKAVRITGSSAFAEGDLARLFRDQVGAPFFSERLEEGILTLLRFYDEHGYPAASVEPEMVRAGRGWLEVTLRVDEGRRATVDNVIFKGLTRTKRNVVLAESGIPVGEIYDGKRLDDVPARLMALGVFEDVSPPVLSFGAGDSVVTVAFDVQESRTNRVEGIVAYAPRVGQGDMIGSLDLELGNIAGTLRSLRVLYDRPGPSRLSWSIAYREPRVAGLPVALDAGILSNVLEDTYALRRVSLGIGLRSEARVELGLGGFMGTTRDRSASGGEGDFRERGLSFDFRYEGRDRPANPRSGGLFFLSHEISTLDFDRVDSEDRTLSSLDAGAELLAGIRGDNVVALGGRFMGAFASPGRVPPSHLMRLGGFGSLRGYPEEWFSVEEALVLTLEARRLVGNDSRIYAFVDAAAMEGAGRRLGDLEQLPFGYGIGFVGGSRNGAFRLEVALGRGDDFSDAKLHLGLIQRF
jgi:translocation and assembly module TamA